jgi:hypothetical protein
MHSSNTNQSASDMMAFHALGNKAVLLFLIRLYINRTVLCRGINNVVP